MRPSRARARPAAPESIPQVIPSRSRARVASPVISNQQVVPSRSRARVASPVISNPNPSRARAATAPRPSRARVADAAVAAFMPESTVPFSFNIVRNLLKLL